MASTPPIIRSLIQSGLHPGLSITERSRVLVLNRAALLCQVVCFILVPLNLALGNQWLIPSLEVALAFLITGVYLGQRRGYYMGTRLFFFFLMLGVGSLAVFQVNITHVRSTGPEIVFYAFGLLALFLFESYYRSLFFGLCVALLLGIEYLKVFMIRELPAQEFFFGIINQGVLWAILYGLVTVYRKQTDRALAHSEKLREENQGRSDQLNRQNQLLATNATQLTEYKRVLHALIDHQPLLLALFGPNGNILVANRQVDEILGFPAQEAVGKTMKDIVTSELFRWLNPLLQKAYQGEAPDFQGWALLPKEQRLYIVGQFVPVENADGSLLGVTLFVRDHTALQEKEAQLSQLNKRKNQLLTLVGEELRTPLRSLHSLLDYSYHNLYDQEEFITYIQRIKDQLGHMALTLENLILWSQVQREDFSPKPQQLQVLPLLQQVAVYYQEIADDRNIEFALEIEDNLSVYMEELHYKILAQNLVDNAVRFAPADTVLVIRAWRTENTCHLVVGDSGKGMPPEFLDSLLTQLKQPFDSEQPDGKINKIGLRLVAHLTSLMQGALDIESQEQVGTNVLISIPATQAAFEQKDGKAPKT